MENNPTKKKKKGLLDLKNISTEDRNKYLAIGVFGLVFCGIMAYGISNYIGDDKNEEVTEFSNPEAEQSKYNSKLEALNPKTKVESSDLEYTFSPANENTQPNNDVDLTQLDKQLSELGSGKNIEKTNNSSTGSGFSSGGSSASPTPSNSHNVYGDYSMWQSKEPANSKIGYSNKKKPVESSNTQVRPTSSPTYTNVGSHQPETKESYYMPYEEKKSTAIVQLAQVKSKVISQGEATNNRSISFVILENFTLNGETISKGKSYAIGVIKLEENRIFAKINTIKANGKTYNVSGKILGYDGEDGLPLVGSSNSNNSTGTGEIIKDEALRQANRIPIVGGIISKASSGSGGSYNKTNKISLAGNIECTIVIFK